MLRPVPKDNMFCLEQVVVDLENDFLVRKVVEEYSEHVKMLAQKLLSLISDSLGLRPSCIEDAVGEFYQNITVSYYPPCPQPELTLGLQSHSDMGAITLLIQDDVGGLEVLKDGEWVIVQPSSDAIVVLLADQTEVMFLSNLLSDSASMSLFPLCVCYFCACTCVQSFIMTSTCSVDQLDS